MRMTVAVTISSAWVRDVVLGVLQIGQGLIAGAELQALGAEDRT